MLLFRTFAAALASMLGAAVLWMQALTPAPTTLPDRSTQTEYPGP